MTLFLTLYTILGFGYLFHVIFLNLTDLKLSTKHFVGMLVFLPHTLFFCVLGYFGWIILTHKGDKL